jgi:hypothetical protein
MFYKFTSTNTHLIFCSLKQERPTEIPHSKNGNISKSALMQLMGRCFILHCHLLNQAKPQLLSFAWSPHRASRFIHQGDAFAGEVLPHLVRYVMLLVVPCRDSLLNLLAQRLLGKPCPIQCFYLQLLQYLLDSNLFMFTLQSSS